MANVPPCPRCQCVVVIKSGHHHGRQRWRCKRCGYQLTLPIATSGASDPTKRAAISLYGHGLSFRAVGRLLDTSAPSVLRWVIAYVDRFCAKPKPGRAVIIVLDEMWHYLRRKAEKLWIWTAIEPDTGRLIDWECGDRDEGTFTRLRNRLTRWGVRLFCTDHYVVYESGLAVGKHYQGKDQSVPAERTHSRLRHWLARFRRRTCVVSRSKAMVDRSIALFAHLHVNGGASKEEIRLRLAA